MNGSRLLLILTALAAAGLVLLARARHSADPAHSQSSPATPSLADSFDDGMPDFARLDSPADRQAFRRWFTFLAEQQFLRDTADLPAEVSDCAGLVRFAFREALRKHDGRWVEDLKLTDVPPATNVVKYVYPFTPLGANLYRVRPGPFRPEDLTDGAFAQFADAQTLMLHNTHPVDRAQPGDLFFYHQPQQNQPFHVMISLGEAVVYHTGDTPGEIRRPTMEELRQHPEPRWRPVAGNPYFLGVYRWNILRD